MTQATVDTLVRDISPGLVLHLQPEVLLAKGGRFENPTPRIAGTHYFLCLVKEDGMGTWAPLYSRMADGRELLDKAGAVGLHHWLSKPSYIEFAHTLRAPHEAVAAAALAGHDLSTPSNRNRMSRKRMPARYRRTTWEVGCFVTVRVVAADSDEARTTAVIANGWPALSPRWVTDEPIAVARDVDGVVYRAGNVSAETLMVREVESE
jgi:hypothetical protein